MCIRDRVSTALPQKDTEGVYYSPRLPGAGLVNAAGAVTTPAYISVAGQNVGKLELKDDPEKTGRYTCLLYTSPHGFFRGVRRPKRFGSRRFRRGPRGVVAVSYTHLVILLSGLLGIGAGLLGLF